MATNKPKKTKKSDAPEADSAEQTPSVADAQTDESTADQTAESTAETPDNQKTTGEESANPLLDEYKEKYLRALADMENLQRRAEKQITDAHRFALSNFASGLGDVRDCLEAAVENAGSGEKMIEGVNLTLKKLVSAMDAHHILPIRPDIGVTFDPQMHMAIGMMPPTAEAPDGTVAIVVQVGYMLHGRVIRAANVMVSRATDESKAAAGSPEPTK